MSELSELLRASAAHRAQGKPLLLATVMRVQGSSYRRPGARMLVTEEGWAGGSVSGGCLEGDVERKGWWRTRDGAPVTVTYDQSSPDDVRWGLGLGCDGVIEILLERLEREAPADPLRFYEGCMAGQLRGALATVFRSTTDAVAPGERLALRADGASETTVRDARLMERLLAEGARAIAGAETQPRAIEVAGGRVDVLVEAVRPPPRLFVFGAGHDAVPLVHFARALGWEGIVCDGAARPGTRRRFAHAGAVVSGPLAAMGARVDASDRAAAVVMSHDYERDRAALGMLLASRARYIGVLGPRRRTARMLAELGEVALDSDPRLHAPVGLQLGAESPSEIALAIAAEIQAVFGGVHAAASLREQPGPIHAVRLAAP